MAKQYAESQTYEAKLEKVMGRLGVDSYDYDWSRRECWVSFIYNGQPYRFTHSLENAQAHGINVKYGSDLFAQVVLSLEDLARMVERGIYELSTWISGMKYLPAPTELPECFRVLGLGQIPKSKTEVNNAFREKAKVLHPDNGGDAGAFHALHQAQTEALAYIEKNNES